MSELVAQSATTAELAKALALAQSEITPAAKDTENPFFHRRYADLASVWEACRGPLTKNGLSVVQCPTAEGATVTVRTALLHSSGEFITSSLSMTSMRQVRDGGGWEKVESPQAIGSTITYARRYALAAMVGVAPDDDDAEAAHGRSAAPPRQNPPPRPAPAAMKPPAERFAQRAETIAAKAEPPPAPAGIAPANTAPAPAPWITRPVMQAAFDDVRATVGDGHYFYILNLHNVSADLHGTAAKLKEAYSVLKLRAAEIATGIEGAAV